jgi:hypothetical protein
MTCIIKNNPNHVLSSKQAAGLALSVFFVLGTFVASALADERGDYRGWNGDHHGWHDRDDGYYPAPPVIYGSPYYYPPPIVYGPGVGVRLPGVSVILH